MCTPALIEERTRGSADKNAFEPKSFRRGYAQKHAFFRQNADIQRGWVKIDIHCGGEKGIHNKFNIYR